MGKIRAWAASLAVVVLAACGGGGGGSSTPPVVVTIAPTAATLTAAANATIAPMTSVTLTATNAPNDGLYVLANNGAKGYVTAEFDGQSSVIITGAAPMSLAAGTYQDTVSVEVCLDENCDKQVAASPITVPVTYTVTPVDPGTLTPTLSTISPTSSVVGGAPFSLLVNGTGFVASSTVLWNGQPRPTTYVSSTQLSAQVGAADIAAIGSSDVSVTNSSTGGGTSSSLSFTVTVPAPAVTSLSPASADSGGSAFTMTVNGTGFDSSAEVSWNGTVHPTTVLSSTQLQVQITMADIATAGNFPVTVTNVNAVTGPSNAVNVPVIDAPLALAAIQPAFVTAGAPAYVETVTGTGFGASSTVQWNGSARPTTVVSSTLLTAQVTAADVASRGSATIAVVNGGSTPVTSKSKTLAITASSTDAVAFQINAQHNGATRFASVLPSTALPTSGTWTAVLDGTPSYALIAGGRVFVTVKTTGGSELVALGAATGATAWGPIALAGTANATYDNGKVIVESTSPDATATLSAYDATSGTRLWTIAINADDVFASPPTAANGIVYVGGAGGGVSAYNDSTGALVWTAAGGDEDTSSPTVTANGVYTSYPCQTFAVNAQTGARLWSNNTGCSGGGGATGTSANGVYYSPNGASGYSGTSFNATTGTLASTYTASVPPVIGAQTGYFLQSGTLRAIGLANSTILWSFAGDGSLQSAPVLVNNYVFVASASRKLYALDAASGTQVWQAALSGAFTTGNWEQLSGMSAGDGLLVVPTGNALTAFAVSNNP